MGQLVVTVKTQVGCSHATPPAHTGGQITPANGDSTLTVAGQPVRTSATIAGQTIDPSGCAQPGNQTNPKCAAVGPAVTAGVATVLTVNGVPVVRADLSAVALAATQAPNGTVLADTVEHSLLTTD